MRAYFLKKSAILNHTSAALYPLMDSDVDLQEVHLKKMASKCFYLIIISAFFVSSYCIAELVSEFGNYFSYFSRFLIFLIALIKNLSLNIVFFNR